MRIKTLSVKNFRSIENLEVEFPPVCALVGPNNSGKSNILEAIRRVLGTGWVTVNSFSSDDIYLRDENRPVNITCRLEPSIAYKKVAGAAATEVAALSFEYTRYKIGPKKGQPRLEQACLDAKGSPAMMMTKALKSGQKPEFAPMTSVPQDIRDQVPLVYIGTNRSLKDQLPSARYSLLRQMFESINRDLELSGKTVPASQGNGKTVDVPIQQRFASLMDSAMALLRTDEFLKVERAIKKNVLEQLGLDPSIDSDKVDLFFTPLSTMDFYKTLDLSLNEGAFTISAQELGDGMQNAIVLGILQAFEETQRQGAIILIEEPEMFLHPQMQRSLYKTLRRIGQKNQVIYTTHSPHFVAVPEYNEVALIRKGGGHTTVRLSTLPLNAQRREKLVKELDPERNELFFARRLLIVEGDTEKLALPEYAKRLGLDLDRAGATIMEVGGKRNLLEFAQIAISFAIPTGVLYDTDSSDFQGNGVEESGYNAKLDALATGNVDVRVWSLDRKYEDHLRSALGEEGYLRACQKFPNVGKPTRARLIAMDTTLPIPTPIEAVLQWLIEKSIAGSQPEPNFGQAVAVPQEGATPANKSAQVTGDAGKSL